MNSENDLIIKNLPLVRSIVKRFKPRNINQYKEYEQAGLIGLMKAIRTHDSNKGALSTIAFYYIRGEIIKYINLEKRQTSAYQSSDLDGICYETPKSVYDRLPIMTPTESKIIELRLNGYSFKDIGIMMGNYSRGWANNIYRNIIKRARE